jgi:hypothetical protein
VKKIVVVLVSVLVAAHFSAFAQTPPKAGGRCTESGLTKVHKGKKYTCLTVGKKLVWNKGVALKKVNPVNDVTAKPSISSTPTSSPKPVDKWIPTGNPVTAAIQRQISLLRLPESATADVEVIAEPGVPSDAVQSLRDQVRFMVEAFPDAYRKSKERYILYKSVAWMKAQAASLGCPTLSNHEEQGDNPPSMMAGATVCTQGWADASSFHVSYINWASFEKHDRAATRNPTGLDMFEFMAGQESSGSALKVFHNNSLQFKNLRPLPAWYDEGGQFAFSSVALAIQTRNWRQSSLQQGGVFICTPGGKLVLLKETSHFDVPGEANGCWYSSGAVATELMVALYGFDAPITWYKKVNLQPDASKSQMEAEWERSFKEAFGESLIDFYAMADSYARYLKTGRTEDLPLKLIQRLARNKPALFTNSSITSVAPKGPTSFDDLIENYQGISYAAWSKARMKILASKSVDVQLDLVIGPNSTLNYTIPKFPIEAVSRLYEGFVEKSTVKQIAFNYIDRDWAVQKMDEIMPNKGSRWIKDVACSSTERCGGGAAFANGTSQYLVVIAVGMKTDNHLEGTLEAHEFTHVVQQMVMNAGNPWPHVHPWPPEWYWEGQALFAQNATIWHESFEMYSKRRRETHNDLFTYNKFDAKLFEEFLSLNSPNNWRNQTLHDGWRLYDIGAMFIEILTALKGPDSTMDLWKLAEKGVAFDSAFEQVYGISYVKALPIMAKAMELQVRR